MLDTEPDLSKKSLLGSAEEIYLNRNSKALQAAFNFRDRFSKEISLSNETPTLIRDVAKINEVFFKIQEDMELPLELEERKTSTMIKQSEEAASDIQREIKFLIIKKNIK